LLFNGFRVNHPFGDGSHIGEIHMCSTDNWFKVYMAVVGFIAVAAIVAIPFIPSDFTL